MTFPRKLSIATAGAAAILSALSVPVSAFTITTEAAWDFYDPLGNLPSGFTGAVTLNPAIVEHLDPPEPGGTFFTQFITDAPTQFPNWIAESGATLNGTLTINKYNARDFAAEPQKGLDTPRGGADMIATYARATTDPPISQLRFIQMFIDNTGPNGTLVKEIDRTPQDPNNMLPWYSAGYSTEAVMIMFDTPHDPVVSPFPFKRTVRFETYLATFDNSKKVATIHDGWSWGYNVEAVPEPVTIFGSAMGLGLGVFFKKYSRKQEKAKNLEKLKS